MAGGVFFSFRTLQRLKGKDLSACIYSSVHDLLQNSIALTCGNFLSFIYVEENLIVGGIFYMVAGKKSAQKLHGSASACLKMLNNQRILRCRCISSGCFVSAVKAAKCLCSKTHTRLPRVPTRALRFLGTLQLSASPI